MSYADPSTLLLLCRAGALSSHEQHALTSADVHPWGVPRTRKGGAASWQAGADDISQLSIDEAWERFLLSWVPHNKQDRALQASLKTIIRTWNRVKECLQVREMGLSGKSPGPSADSPSGIDVLLSSTWKPGPFKLRSFLHDRKSELAGRLKWACYNPPRLAGRHVLIVGAGPAGLRMAVECKLNGADVTLLESRDGFSRVNVLHIWPFTYRDLVSLGVKTFYGELGRDPAKTTVPIAYMQHALLRVALVLGVDVRIESKFQKLQRVQDRWQAQVSSPGGEEMMDFDAIVDGTGNRAAVFSSAGPALPTMQRKQFKAPAGFAVTANFQRYSRDIKEPFALNMQYHRKVFAGKRVALQNIVYFRSPIAHYMVATVDGQATLFGSDPPVLKEHLPPDKLVAGGNVDRAGLERFSKVIAEDFGIPNDEGLLEEGAPGRLRKSCAIFEFTRMMKATHCMDVLPGRPDHPQVLMVVGDAALSPFWPEGTGANRAVKGALDQTWNLVAFFTRRDSADTLAMAHKRFQKLCSSSGGQIGAEEYNRIAQLGYPKKRDDDVPTVSPRSRIRGVPNPELLERISSSREEVSSRWRGLRDEQRKADEEERRKQEERERREEQAEKERRAEREREQQAKAELEMQRKMEERRLEIQRAEAERERERALEKSRQLQKAAAEQAAKRAAAERAAAERAAERKAREREEAEQRAKVAAELEQKIREQERKAKEREIAERKAAAARAERERKQRQRKIEERERAKAEAARKQKRELEQKMREQERKAKEREMAEQRAAAAREEQEREAMQREMAREMAEKERARVEVARQQTMSFEAELKQKMREREALQLAAERKAKEQKEAEQQARRAAEREREIAQRQEEIEQKARLARIAEFEREKEEQAKQAAHNQEMVEMQKRQELQKRQREAGYILADRQREKRKEARQQKQQTEQGAMLSSAPLLQERHRRKRRQEMGDGAGYAPDAWQRSATRFPIHRPCHDITAEEEEQMLDLMWWTCVEWLETHGLEIPDDYQTQQEYLDMWAREVRVDPDAALEVVRTVSHELARLEKERDRMKAEGDFAGAHEIMQQMQEVRRGS